MKQSTLICLILFLSFSSCTKVILFVMGAEQPKYKSDKDVIEYAQKTFDYDGDILRLKAFNDDSKFPFGIRNMPTVMYAEKGSMNKYVTTCSADYSDIIERYNSGFEEVEVDTTFFADDVSRNLYSSLTSQIYSTRYSHSDNMNYGIHKSPKITTNSKQKKPTLIKRLAFLD